MKSNNRKLVPSNTKKLDKALGNLLDWAMGGQFRLSDYDDHGLDAAEEYAKMIKYNFPEDEDDEQDAYAQIEYMFEKRVDKIIKMLRTGKLL